MSASCDKPEHAGLLPVQHLVEHLRWGCTGQAQQAWLLEAVFAEHAHQLAEQQRALPLSGVEAGIRDALANHIDPKVEQESPSEVVVRYADGLTMRLRDFDVTPIGDRGLGIEGRLSSGNAWPRPGSAVRLAQLEIPGRGALADVTASVRLDSIDDATIVSIGVNLDLKETP